MVPLVIYPHRLLYDSIVGTQIMGSFSTFASFFTFGRVMYKCTLGLKMYEYYYIYMAKCSGTYLGNDLD